jgi:bifunctional DNase/RNase
MTVNLDAVPRDEWIEMFPYGIAVGPGEIRPVMIFKDATEKRVLPIWLSPVDAGIAVSQSEASHVTASPHHLTWKILKPLGVRLEKCFFTEVKGAFQFVRLEFSGSKKLLSLESRADEAISFCLSTQCRFYTKVEFIERCRVLEGEMVSAFGKVKRNQTENPYLN